MLFPFTRPAVLAAISGYLKIEPTYESNVFETTDSVQADAVLPMWLGVHNQGFFNKLKYRWDFTGSLAPYYHHSGENKTSFSYHPSLQWEIMPRCMVGTELDCFGKFWYREKRGYFLSHLNVYVRYQRGNNLVGFGYSTGADRFAVRSHFNNNLSGFFIETALVPVAAVSIINTFALRKVFYPERRVASYSLIDSLIDDFQCDRMLIFHQGFEFRSGSLTGINLKIIKNSSNNSLADFTQVGLDWYHSRHYRNFYLNVLLEISIKKYSEKLKHIDLRYNPDPEQNIQNQLALGWEYPLTSDLAVTGKCGVMRSETQYSARYYWKSLFALGVQKTFD